MKKYLVTTALALSMGAIAFAAPASAQVQREKPWFIADPQTRDASVEVYGEVDKEQDKYVFELQLKLKLALVIVYQVLVDNTAAESIVVVEQENFRNTVTHGTSLNDLGLVNLTANTQNSINRNTGVTQVNVDVGNMVNQGNVLAVSWSRDAAFADALAAAEQFSNFNTSTTWEDPPQFTPAFAQKRIVLNNSVNANRGVTQFNINVGNMNNQLNAVSVAIGSDNALSLSEALLGQETVGNKVQERGTIRTTTVTNSMNGNTGITSGNVATGNMNNQATVISLAGSASF